MDKSEQTYRAGAGTMASATTITTLKQPASLKLTGIEWANLIQNQLDLIHVDGRPNLDVELPMSVTIDEQIMEAYVHPEYHEKPQIVAF